MDSAAFLRFRAVLWTVCELGELARAVVDWDTTWGIEMHLAGLWTC